MKRTVIRIGALPRTIAQARKAKPILDKQGRLQRAHWEIVRTLGTHMDWELMGLLGVRLYNEHPECTFVRNSDGEFTVRWKPVLVDGLFTLHAQDETLLRTLARKVERYTKELELYLVKKEVRKNAHR